MILQNFSFVLGCLFVANALVVPGGKMYVLNVGEGTGAGLGQHISQVLKPH